MISDVLSKRRKELGRKPSEIAKKIGVSESTYREWENGRRIQGEPYKRISEALEINILTLLEVESVEHSFMQKELKKIEKSVRNIRLICNAGK